MTFFFFSSRRRHTRSDRDWSSDVCSSDLVVSRSDPEGRRTVFDLLPKVPGLTYVGRLDVMTSGLLLLTTDGAAAHRLMHPRYEVPRSYWLAVHGADAAEVRAALAQRIVIDGRAVRVVDSRVRPAGRSVEVEI